MSWHYIVVKKVCPDTGDETFGVHEEYHLDKGEVYVTEEPIKMSFSSLQELNKALADIHSDYWRYGVKNFEDY